jgi:threonine/homoserine/homoserine lactone efflux protein
VQPTLRYPFKQSEAVLIELAALPAFILVVLLLMLLPEPGMALVRTHAAHRDAGGSIGRTGCIATALGIGAACLLMVLPIAAAVTAAAILGPATMDVLRYAGAACMLWIACKVLHYPLKMSSPRMEKTSGPSGIEAINAAGARALSAYDLFLNAMGNHLRNPRAWFFMALLLPQFIARGGNAVAQQLIILGGVFAILITVLSTVLGMTCHALQAGVCNDLFRPRRPSWKRHAYLLHSYALAALLLLLALRLLAATPPA